MTASVTPAIVEVIVMFSVEGAIVVVRFQLQAMVLMFGGVGMMGGLYTWAPIPIQKRKMRLEKRPAYAPCQVASAETAISTPAVHGRHDSI